MKKFPVYLTTLILCIGEGFAIIPLSCYRGITELFTDKHYSPTMGAAALESGLIYNLRFYGLFKNGMGQDTEHPGTLKRSWVRDAGSDPIAQLIITLFPSSAGVLNSFTRGDRNFGKFATPGLVAELLNYMYELRHGGSAESLSAPTTSSGSTSPSQSTPSDRWAQSLPEGMDRARFKQAIRPVLTYVTEAIGSEKTSLYPVYTSEQIVLAFFAHRFNTMDDMKTLLSGFNERLIPNKQAMNTIQPWTKARHKYFMRYQYNPASPNLDALLMHTYVEFDKPIPYGLHSPVMENGDSPIYDRQKNELSDTFADCGETALRHMGNIFLYRKENNGFVMPKVQSAFFKPLVTFYQKQDPSCVNNGHCTFRGWWNRVVGDLPGIKYASTNPGYDLAPGFVNFFKVWGLLLGQDLVRGIDQQSPQALQGDDWLKQAFMPLIQVLYPEAKSVIIAPQGMTLRNVSGLINRVEANTPWWGGDDLLGTVKISFQNGSGEKIAFNIVQQSRHAFVSGIQHNERGAVQVQLPQLQDPCLDLICHPRNAHHPLYKLFTTSGRIETESQQEQLIHNICNTQDDRYVVFMNKALEEVSDDIKRRLYHYTYQLLKKKINQGIDAVVLAQAGMRNESANVRTSAMELFKTLLDKGQGFAEAAEVVRVGMQMTHTQSYVQPLSELLKQYATSAIQPSR